MICKTAASMLTDLDQVNTRELPRSKARLKFNHRCLVKIG